MICRASWKPLGDRACRASADAVALLLCSVGAGRLPATINRWLICWHSAHGQRPGSTLQSRGQRRGETLGASAHISIRAGR